MHNFGIIKYFKKYQIAIFGGLLCLILGMLSGSSTSAYDYAWYDKLQQPNFSPPKWAFGVVWTILYFMIGVAFSKILQAKQPRLPRKLTIITLILHSISNLSWSYIFFSMRKIELALYDLTFIWISLIALLIITKKISSVFWWLFPYLIWVSFAWCLNFSIYQLNN